MTHHARRLIAPLLTVTLAACGGNVAPPSAPSTTGPASQPASAAAPTPGGTLRATPIPVPTGEALGDRLVATIEVSNAPCALAADATSAWVTSNSSGALDRVDPATNTVVQHAIIGLGPCGIAIGSDGRVWIADLGKKAVIAVDPVSMKVTATIDNVGPALWDLKAGFGSIWVTDRTAKQLLRIDPTTARVTSSIEVGPRAAGIAVLEDGVWVADEVDSQLRRIDPKTNKVSATVTGSGTPTWFSDDASSNLLIAERGLGEVLIVDRSGATLSHPTSGWTEPLDGTVFAGRAWIPDGSGRKLGVIDLATPDADPVRYALPGAINPFVAEPAFGDVWVLDFSGTTVWRIRP
jgi:DNA-binding beta-propeller fold protein YncE